MSTQISTFNFKSHQVRIQSFNNEPYFCLSDVCDVLGLNRRSAETFNLNEKGCNNIATLTKGGEQIITFINEPNLYRIIFKSRKAEAVEFQNWVFEEVLPQIRKTGQYALQNSAPKRKRGRPAVNPFNYETYQREFVAKELETLVQLWYYADKQHQFLQSIVPAFEMLNSDYADEIKRYRFDKMSIDWAGDIIARLCDGAEVMRLAPLITLEKRQRAKHAITATQF